MSMTIKETIYQLEAVRDSCRAHGNTFDADVLNHCIDSVMTFREPKAEHYCNPQPLTMAELRNMNGETVYCEDVNADVKIHAYEVGLIFVRYKDHFEDVLFKAKDVTLYRHKPKEGET